MRLSFSDTFFQFSENETVNGVPVMNILKYFDILKYYKLEKEITEITGITEITEITKTTEPIQYLTFNSLLKHFLAIRPLGNSSPQYRKLERYITD